MSIQNPAYLDELPENWKEARKLRDEGEYDGVITPDGKYLAFEKTQIKSTYNRGTFDSENPNIYYQSEIAPEKIDAENVENYKEFVNKVLDKKLTKSEKGKPLNLGKTPAKIVEAGLPENDLIIGSSVVEKANKNKNSDHNLSKETISNVYEALHDPIAIIKGEQKENETAPNNRYAVILDL